ncbi:phosphatidylserine decarboxylase proenzyme, mitochondrial isoform X2 [Copidosoma floridanum]|uniref:phosphatidylserine decarboxylase proenzyme, mitochondrial isoform X2 n=1 Tax=Copidosoma floridanum TaxID=29053 RepID=UPI0006C9E1AB|nr:phosphatidylserine decarboxylase proenzyme, mitochondrial isoform X2 [Copidosoma floridanum]
MPMNRISRLAVEVARYEARITYKCSYAVIRSAKKIVTSLSGQGLRSQSTEATKSKQSIQAQTAQESSDNNSSVRSWRSYVGRWQWQIPLGLGIYLLAVLQWRYFRKRHETNKGPIEGLMVECYCSLPLRITSRVWGGFASLQLPVSLRSTIYSCYAKIFKANLDEVDAKLTEFPSLSDFFVRPLKPDARIIAQNSSIVSPSDGKVLHYGPVTSCKVEQVKGITYNLQHFLGEPNWPRIDKKTDSGINKTVCDDYVTSLLKNPENVLYQLTVYLAPGDYHRFHSPADWTIKLRRHFQGKLLSVNPRIASWMPDLFSQNERVVYIGEWEGGFMAYTAVGATNVGSIRVYKDQNLVTNTKKWPRGKNSEDTEFDDLKVTKGELFGEFRMGSTIVLLFEAPRDFKFCTEVGQKIKMGQGLTEPETSERRQCK